MVWIFSAHLIFLPAVSTSSFYQQFLSGFCSANLHLYKLSIDWPHPLSVFCFLFSVFNQISVSPIQAIIKILFRISTFWLISAVRNEFYQILVSANCGYLFFVAANCILSDFCFHKLYLSDFCFHKLYPVRYLLLQNQFRLFNRLISIRKGFCAQELLCTEPIYIMM